MKTITIIICLPLLVLLFPSASAAQTKFQKILNTINKNTTNQTNTNSTQKTSPANANNNAGSSGNTGLARSVAPGGLKVGDVAPDAVYIDADNFDFFNGGAAVVFKGKAAALIDPKGNFLVAYNKIPFSTSSMEMKSVQKKVFFSGGLFNSFGMPYGHEVVINSSGKTLYEGAVTRLFDEGKYAFVNNYGKGDLFVDYAGKKYPSPVNPNEAIMGISEGIILKSQNQSSNKNSYVTIEGKSVGNRTFETAFPFSDGMAIVGAKDEFGEMKYGYLDRSGKMAIPFQYSIMPSDFINGMAMVFPKIYTDFLCAFINRKGEIIYKVTREMSQTYQIPSTASYCSSFLCDHLLYLSPKALIDSTGKITDLRSYLQNKNIQLGNLNPMPSDTKMDCFFGINGKNQIGNYSRQFFGSLNLNKGYIITPVFENELYFDPVSKLAHAKMIIEKGNGYTNYREGYINEYGVFVIVKKEQSAF